MGFVTGFKKGWKGIVSEIRDTIRISSESDINSEEVGEMVAIFTFIFGISIVLPSLLATIVAIWRG